jgi:sporulation protein YlmC with PRC-barrel domain
VKACSDWFAEVENSLADQEVYDQKVYDQDSEKIGMVDDLFVDENDNPKYIGKIAHLAPEPTLIPVENVCA